MNEPECSASSALDPLVGGSKADIAAMLCHLQYLTNQLPNAMWVTDRNLRLLNGFGAGLGDGLDIERYRGVSLFSILGNWEGGAAPLAAHLQALDGASSRFVLEFRGHSLEASVEPLRGHDGSVTGCIGHAVDVSQRLAAEKALRTSEERFELIARAVSDAIWDWNPATGAVWWSEGVRNLFGHDSAVGQITSFEWYEDKIHPDDRSHVVQSLEEAISGSALTWAAEYRFRRADDSYAEVADRGLVQWDADGNVLRMVGGLQDITIRKQLEYKLYRQSFEDQLSGLPNRVLFLERLQHALDQRKAQRNALAVLFIDLDAFKSINDSLGHPAGDILLADVAGRLSCILGPEATFARLGSDEFAILIEDIEYTSDIVELAGRLMNAIRQPWIIDSRDLNITASIGIASIERTVGDLQAAEVLRRADAAMYRAKKQGKDRYAFYEPSLDKEASARFEVELGLRSAIERGQLVLHFQPEVNLTSGRIDGMEALVRWQHPQRGLLPPAEFIPIAEKTDLILAIDDWVFQEVCRQASAWQPLLADQPDFTIGVNLSARQFARPGLSERISTILRYFNISAGNVLLEITETATTFDINAAVSQMQALKKLGVRLAIDDFGTGFASLTYLRRFPIDVLKIDRSFIEDVKDDPAARIIVQGVTTLARLLKLSVIAEGIETVEQLREVVDLGCHRGQGFFFGQPLDTAEATELIKHGLPGIKGVTPLHLRAAS